MSRKAWPSRPVPASSNTARTLRIFVGIILLGGAACREKSPEPAAQGSAAPTPPATRPGPAIAAPQPPSLGADAGVAAGPQPALPPAQTPEAAFTSQTRDAEWAPATETEIKRRFKQVRGAKLEQTECREDRCRLVVAGSEADVGQTIADLESDRGLHGFATNVLLTAPERKPDGSIVLRAFAIFER